MRLSSAASLFLCLALGVACASRKHLNPPTFTYAWSLRGHTFEEVVQKIGAPSDRDTADRAYWFLSEESENFPEPTPILYSFVFFKGKLARIERADKAPALH